MGESRNIASCKLLFKKLELKNASTYFALLQSVVCIAAVYSLGLRYSMR